MSATPPIDPDELIVKADYFLPVDHDEQVLSRIKRLFAETLLQDGYRQVDPDINPFSPASRTMTFQLEIQIPDPSLWFRIRKRLGFTTDAQETKVRTDRYMEQVGRKRPDIPFEVELHFRTITLQDDEEGYEVEVIARPMLLQLQHHQLLSEDEEYDIKSAVTTTKHRIKRYMRKVEAQTFREPYTEAELLETTLAHEYRDALRETAYGRTAIQYIDEGDKCFQRENLHAALSCYIHAIEWTIIGYLDRTDDIDVIEHEQAESDVYYGYQNLVDKIRNDTPTSQRTMSFLDKLNGAERRWIAHHKSGDTVESDVDNVRERLFVLIDELHAERIADTEEQSV